MSATNSQRQMFFDIVFPFGFGDFSLWFSNISNSSSELVIHVIKAYKKLFEKFLPQKFARNCFKSNIKVILISYELSNEKNSYLRLCTVKINLQ